MEKIVEENCICEENKLFFGFLDIFLFCHIVPLNISFKPFQRDASIGVLVPLSVVVDDDVVIV